MNSSRLSVLTIIFLFISTYTYGQEVVAEYSGNGIQNTRPFTVSNAWEVNWEASGDIFQLYLYTADGSMTGVVANQQGSGSGSSYQPQTGEYYFKVNAIGEWNIEIVESSNNSTSSSYTTSSGTIASFSGSGAKNTRPITTNSAWELQWDAEGDIFQVYLYSENGSLEGVIANQSKPGEGSSYQPQTGSYYFKVNALGDWSMKVVKSE